MPLMPVSDKRAFTLRDMYLMAHVCAILGAEDGVMDLDHLVSVMKYEDCTRVTKKEVARIVRILEKIGALPEGLPGGFQLPTTIPA